jgi:hypothetical protein
MEILFPGKPRPKLIYGLKVGTDIGFLPTSPGKTAEFILGIPFFRKYGVIFANKPTPVVHPETTPPKDAEFTWDHCALIG